MSPGSNDLNYSPLTTQLQHFSQKISLVVVLIGFAVIVGWVFDIAVLKSILPGLPTMKLNTAVGFLLGGTSLQLWHWELNRKKANETQKIQLLSCIASCLMVFIALLTLIQYGFNVNLGIDQGLMQQPELLGSTTIPGRMAPNTALAFLFEGLALLLLSLPRPKDLAVQGMALGAGLLGFLGLLGYVYRSAYFYTAGSFTGMAVHTALSLVLLSSGVLCARPDWGIMPLVNSDGAGSLMARRLLPLAIVLPPWLEGLSHLGYHWHLYTEEVQASLMSTFDILLFTGLIGWNSYMLNRLDSHRRRAERTLQNLNTQLREELLTRNQAEEALQTSQSRFAGILEIASDAVISVDERQRITLFNQGAEKVFGYTRDEVMNQPLDLLLPMRFAQGHRQYVRDFAHSQGEARRMAERSQIFGRRKDGTEFPAEASISKLKVEGKIVFTAFLRDISDAYRQAEQRQRTEETLRESEERFRSAFDHAAIGMALVAIDGRWLKVNRSLCDLVGYTEQELLSLSFQDITHPEDMEVDLGYARQLIAGEIRSYQLEKRYFHADGHVVWILLSGSMVRDAQGNPLYFIAQIQDISERKQAEKLLALQAVVVKNMAGGVCLIRATDNTIVYANPKFESLFGYALGELNGKLAHVINYEEADHSAEQTSLAIIRQLHQYGEATYEVHNVKKNGTPFWCRAHTSVFEHPEYGTVYVAVQEDITEYKRAEQALRESEERFRAIFNQTFQFVGLLKPDGTLLEANQTALDFGGFTRSQVINRPFWEARWWTISAKTQEQLKAAIARAAQGEFVRYEVDVLGAGGRVATIDFSLRPIFDDTGGVKLLIPEGRDISDRKASEEALKQSELTLRSFFESRSMLMGIVELYNNDILHVSDNQVTAQFFCTTSEAMQNRFASDLGVPQASIKVWINHYRQAEQIQAPVQFEYPHQTPNGQRWLSATVCPIAVSPSGHPRFSYIVQDITQRKRAEESLRRYERIVSATTDSMCLMDRNYTYQLVNQAYLTLHGKQFEEIIGHSVQEFLGTELFETLLKPRLDQCLAGEVVNFQMWLEYPTTGRQFLGITYAPYFEADNTISGLVVSIRNLTDLKQAELELQRAKEAAEVANRAKSLFLASMSHELRTPLNIMLGFTQVMNRDSSLTSEQRESLQIISRSGHHLLALINDVLDLSKIEAGRLTLDESSFDLISLLRSLREMFNQKAESKGLPLHLEIASDVPRHVISDSNKLRQVLINLLGNAIKFTQKGSISLKVNTKQETGKSETTKELDKCIDLTFEVSDTGVGIDPNEINSIFEAFVQSQAGKVAPEGTGLGLAISRKFVRLMGGDITVRSTLGEGSRFRFEIPVRLALASEVTPTQQQRQVIGLAPGQPPYRILVADDQAENRQLLVKLLTPLGLEVQEAKNGEEAVILWQQWQPHLIWMDIRMPQMDGYEATQRIRSSAEGQAAIIIALTAHVSSSDRTLALFAGCNDFISKPFQEETLFAKMAEYLGLRYVYAQNDPLSITSHDDHLPAQADVLTAQNLSVMPLDWMTQLHQAAQLCDDEEIFLLIKQIPSEQASLIAYLSRLAHDFQFQPIVTLTESDSRLKNI